jgi:hypothetical protein
MDDGTLISGGAHLVIDVRREAAVRDSLDIVSFDVFGCVFCKLYLYKN